MASVSEREARHLAWLNEADNGERLARESLDCYRRYGRGFWLVSYQLNERKNGTQVLYLEATGRGRCYPRTWPGQPP